MHFKTHIVTATTLAFAALGAQAQGSVPSGPQTNPCLRQFMALRDQSVLGYRVHPAPRCP